MNIDGHDIAVCSWSLQSVGMGDLVRKVKDLGLEHVQLALGDLVLLDDKQKHLELGHLRASGIKLTGGMMGFAGEDYSTIDRIRQTGGFVPDAEWPLRKRLSIEGAKLARELGIPAITSHIGFVPHAGDKAGYAIILARVRELAEAFAGHGIDLLMETGQEPANELLDFLHEVNAPNVHINFDPANMILYGAGDPVQALRALGKHVRHVHVKDATASVRPGVEWGMEVPFGSGQVDVPSFVATLRPAGYAGPLAIEREAGDDRMGDVRIAIRTLQAAAARDR